MMDAVLFEERAALGGKKVALAQLNAEATHNALNFSMIERLLPQLKKWQADEDILCVFLHGAGDKAFCAGGDVVALHAGSAAYGEDLPNNDCAEFFELEYRLDHLIHTFGKPFVVWGTGFVMGGGLGLLSGASHRVVTETTRMAMPEISIGLYPDVGGTWFLNRAPGNTGLFLGLTGAHLNGADAQYVGLADYFVTQELKAEVMSALTEVRCANGVAGVLQHFSALAAASKPLGHVAAHIDWIEESCAAADLLTVLNNITGYRGDDQWCARAAQTLAAGCPVTPYLVWEQLARGKDLTLEDVFRLELTLSMNAVKRGHFKEGVRALLIDKDKQPRWTPATFAEVSGAEIEAFFVEPWDAHPLADLKAAP